MAGKTPKVNSKGTTAKAKGTIAKAKGTMAIAAGYFEACLVGFEPGWRARIVYATPDGPLNLRTRLLVTEALGTIWVQSFNSH